MRFIDQFNDEPTVDPERDVPNVRIVYLGNGRKIKLERRDPYGFVFIFWDKGSAPAELQGSYTDFDRARLALELYINNNTFETTSDVPTEKVVPVKYKKRFRDPATDENLPV